MNDSDVSSEPLIQLDGQLFGAALVSGIHRVVGQQRHLNKINVFPVADSDTGTNLSLSLGAALGMLQRTPSQPLGAMLAELADTLLDSARGNSGAIMAQFFQGMSDSVGEVAHFTSATFSKAVNKGSDYAHDALSEPREGTILSVIAAFAGSLSATVEEALPTDFRGVLSVAQRHVDKALADTPRQLEVLRKAGVVDAGAQGFAELVAGMTEHIRDNIVVAFPENSDLGAAEEPTAYGAGDAASNYRFCTECLVTGVDINRRKLRETLNSLGDSLVLAGTKRKAKIHIHANEPEEVFSAARKFGDLSQQKADDMHKQQATTHARRHRFAVITDSAADFSDTELEQYDIHMVPCRIQFGERGYLDKLSISVDEFYEELETNVIHPTTSQPAPGDFRRQFQFLASHYDDVVSINLTAEVSGTFAAAQSAAERTNAGGRIHVINSRNASVGQGQLVVAAAQCASTGGNVAEALEAVGKLAASIKTFALLHRLDYAVRGGRVPEWVKSVASVLRLLPVLAVKDDGKIGLGGFLFGRRKRLRKFADFVAARIDQSSDLNLRIGHAMCHKEAATLSRLLAERVPRIRSSVVCELGTAIGVHGGPGTIVVSLSTAPSAPDVAVGID